MKTLIIPSFNEGEAIYKMILHAIEIKDLEIIVVDDASTDDTEKILRPFDITYLKNAVNMGKGYSVKRGILAANGDTIFFTDGDSSYDVKNILLGEKLLNAGADIVCGKRYGKYPKIRCFTSFIYNHIANYILKIHICDLQCGFKGFKKAVAKNLFSVSNINGFAFDTQIIYLAKKMNYKIISIPVKLRHQCKKGGHLAINSIKMLVDLMRIS